ncbi:putative mechanosensitive ion channel MscS [Rosa chinensis]|uniref:Mechanosensitive ion channel protein n=1 Tax=Rosa chinensis TaxID=74649 RepID=A0A2P6QKB7_ROSCH|nr:mechanosensitive ion channel protein 6 isoform X1 [Rosa chinensis]XP_040361538.1 mechanosensitive ion channel protein 6 isoform X1 [Rosa chinensis]XP_040361539.1 mechanosensitive ion channel protein 6 isoform X1 [Rosa chinensis]XP_040361540.1 mechanosensitive ion channel protein 6 isoform X1 [Rosa chinensis]XP_040361541.1 mechanosensitive ion channel protein 6 isoform X1 [Rosa chinensis]PRQ34618.1 putative mechanosensitive ion channel MscS [Rosa chinensis]
MDFSLKKSFKSHGSSKHMRKISAGAVEDNSHEELPILIDHQSQASIASDSPGHHRREVIVKIDEGDSSATTIRENVREVEHGGTIWRESSLDFWTEDDGSTIPADGNAGSGGFHFVQRGKQTAPPTAEEDPPSKLIGQYLKKQRASGGDVSLDMDLEMDELQKPPLAEPPRISEASRELKVSFQSPARSELPIPETGNDSVRRRNKDSVVDDERRRSSRLSNGGADVIRCSSNKSFRREASFQNNNLLRIKTKSRLIDPPESWDEVRVPKSGPMKSGMLGKGGGGDDDDEDPFLEEDLPDEYKRVKLDALTLLQWLSLVLIIGALVCTLSLRVLRQKHLWKLKLWKWEVLILVSICGRLVSGWVIKIMVFFVERNFLLRKRVLYFVYGIRRAVQNCIWLGFVLTAWHFMLIRKVEQETNSKILEYVTKGLLCLLIGVLLWLLKTLVVKVLASSFHVRSYFDRIQDALFNQYVIQTLSGRPLIEVQNAEDEEERLAEEVRKLQNAGATMPPDLRSNAFPSARIGRAVGSGSGRSGRFIAASGALGGKSGKFSRPTMSKKSEEAAITIDHLHRLNPKNVSAWNMKRLMNIVRKGHLTTLDEQILDSSAQDEGDTMIKSEVEAKAAAKKIFRNVARPGSKHIYLEDLLCFMGEEEALKTMSLFEGASETRRIRKNSLKNWVVNCFRERRALSLTLNDTKTAVNRLRHVVDVIVGIVIIVIWLLVLDIITSANLVYATSQLVVVAFVFGNTCRTVFEAVIFLFVMHPFDVGDRCEIQGVQMVVEEMNILTTVFLRYDNIKIVYPNSTLSTLPINNFYRSPDTGDAVEFCVHISTPQDKIAVMKQRMISYIESKKEHWYPQVQIVLKDVEELNKMRYALWLTHKMNFQDVGEKWERRALLLEEMVRIFQELDIQYRLLPIDINVRAMPPTTTTGLPPSNFSATTS